MYKVNEIFCSLQGEGYNTGTASVFIRLSGCNLHCAFCDTRHEEGTMMSLPEIVEQVMPGKRIAIETNGTRPLPHGIDWVTLSPKTGLGNSGDLPVVLTRCDELKVVYLGQDLSQYDSITAAHRYLQPCWVANPDQCRSNMQATVQAVLDHPEWRLSLQTHRILGIQ